MVYLRLIDECDHIVEYLNSKQYFLWMGTAELNIFSVNIVSVTHDDCRVEYMCGKRSICCSPCAPGSKSQNAVWNALTAGTAVKDKAKEKPVPEDPRSPEEILGEDLPPADGPEATLKASVRWGRPPLPQTCVYNQMVRRNLTNSQAKWLLSVKGLSAHSLPCKNPSWFNDRRKPNRSMFLSSAFHYV